MGKKELKKQYENLDVSLIDIISKLDKTKTKKITPFLLKMANNVILERGYNEYQFDGKIKVNNWIESVLCDFTSDILGHSNIEIMDEFIDHLENNRIEKNDINQYSSWDEIISEKNIADFKLMDKEAIKQVLKIYEDEEWLLIKPLSLKASLAYGSNTKWCTASKHNEEYFYRYSKNGILIYILNKKNGKKHGFYHSSEELSFWNQIDQRVDSMETEIPYDILMIIRENSDLKKYGKNLDYFSEEEHKNFLYYYGHKKINAEQTYNDYPIDVETEILEPYPDDEYGVYETMEERGVELMPEIESPIIERAFRNLTTRLD